MSISKNVVLSALLVLGVIGLFELLRSPYLGREAANAWLSGEPGGGADTGTFLAMQNAFIAVHQWVGALLLGAGLVALVRRS